MKMFRICMEIDEYVWNIHEKQWKCTEYVWKFMNMYKILKKNNENV